MTNSFLVGLREKTTCIVSNVQIAIDFARRNRNDEFACIYLRSRAFASNVHDRLDARTCVHAYIRARRELHLKSIK